METDTDRQRLARSVPDTAIALSIGREHAYDLIKRGDIRAIRLGHKLVVPESVIRDILAGRARGDAG
jgi:Helix-turn-helix domain